MSSFMRRVCLVVISCLSPLFVEVCHAKLPAIIQIGALYEYESRNVELGFKNAVARVNNRRDILKSTRLVYDIQNVYSHDSFHASKKACYLAEQKVVAIFGPTSAVSSAQVLSMCESLELPHIQARPPASGSQAVYSVNLFPNPSSIGNSLVDLIKHYKWRQFTMLYEENLGYLDSVITMPDIDDYKIVIRKLHKKNGSYLSLLKQLKLNNHHNILVHASFKATADLLEQIQLQCMHGEKYHYIFTSLDLTINDLSKFMYGGANITSLRLVDTLSPNVQHIVKEMNKEGEKPLMTTEAALTYDAVTLLALALDRLDKLPSVFEPTTLACNGGGNWNDGYSLINYMKTTTFQGLSGVIQYDHTGSRKNISLDIMEMTINGMEKTGVWYNNGGLQFLEGYKPDDKDKERKFAAMQNRTLRVTTILEPPFVMIRDKDDNTDPAEGSGRFYGYCIDLIDIISKNLNFHYEVHIVKDAEFGVPIGDTGRWTGMVGELLTDDADVAIGPFTINSDRNEVIDFTKPFMNTGLSILYKRPKKEPPSLFSFLDPFNWKIWLYVIATYILVSFIMFVVSRFTPYEWKNPHPCNQNNDEEENDFNLWNALWFAIGCLMQQGSDLAPTATSTRLIGGVWWFFTLIMISSYTANLAAFLTVTNMKVPIENADQLSRQTLIKYGTRAGGNSEEFFKRSKIETYSRMWNFMSTTPGVMVNSTQEGIEKVKEGKYAFLMESAMREYPMMQECDLMPIGGLLNEKGYGIGLTKGSPLRDQMSAMILKLGEDQKLQELHQKWWKKSGKPCASDTVKASSTPELQMENVGGVFVFLLAGLGVSIFICLAEYCTKARKWDLGPKKTMSQQLFEDIRFAFNCFGSSSRPTRKEKGDNDDIDTNENMNGSHRLVSFPLTANYPDKYDDTI